MPLLSEPEPTDHLYGALWMLLWSVFLPPCLLPRLQWFFWASKASCRRTVWKTQYTVHCPQKCRLKWLGSLVSDQARCYLLGLWNVLYDNCTVNHYSLCTTASLSSVFYGNYLQYSYEQYTDTNVKRTITTLVDFFYIMNRDVTIRYDSRFSVHNTVLLQFWNKTSSRWIITRYNNPLFVRYMQKTQPKMVLCIS